MFSRISALIFPALSTFSEVRRVVLARPLRLDTMDQPSTASLASRRNPVGKMEQTLKSEITRLAKKHVRATYLPLARRVSGPAAHASFSAPGTALSIAVGPETHRAKVKWRCSISVKPERRP
jgi:hypothetical protein